MKKFEVGDRIKAPSSDRYGWNYATIEKTSIIDGEITYWVEWQHNPDKHFDYRAEEVNNFWELAESLPSSICPVIIASKKYVATLPVGHTGNLSVSSNDKTSEIINKGCDHVWMNYNGFTENYQFCYKCDEKRKR